MNLSQFTVRNRLLIGFGSILTTLTVILFVGLQSLSSLDDVLIKNGDYGTQEISAVAKAIGKGQGAALGMQRLIVSEDPERKAAEKKGIDIRIKEYRESMDQLRDLYKKDPSTTEKEREMLQQIDTLAAAAIPALEKTTALGMGTDMAATRASLTGTNASAKAWTDMLGNLRDFEFDKSLQAAQKAHEEYRNARNILIFVALSGAFLSVVLAFAIARSIQRQLGGEPSEAAEVAKRIAAGDLQVQVPVQTGDRSSLMSSISQMRDQLVNMVGDIRLVTENISSASSEIANGNADLSNRTENQAASLEQTAASMSELTETVRQNADNANQANRFALEANALSDTGSAAVQTMVETISRISNSSNKISDITGVIEGIAFQTNILALNAAVEAARAGEQGRGFAVVASEVRSLAQRAAVAAKEIKTLIASSVTLVSDGAAQAENVNATMVNINQAIKQVSEIISQIASASHEQRLGIEQVNQAVSHMDSVTQQNAALVEEAAAAAKSLADQSVRLAQLMSFFRLSSSVDSGYRREQPIARDVMKIEME